ACTNSGPRRTTLTQLEEINDLGRVECAEDLGLYCRQELHDALVNLGALPFVESRLKGSSADRYLIDSHSAVLDAGQPDLRVELEEGGLRGGPLRRLALPQLVPLRVSEIELLRLSPYLLDRDQVSH